MRRAAMRARSSPLHGDDSSSSRGERRQGGRCAPWCRVLHLPCTVCTTSIVVAHVSPDQLHCCMGGQADDSSSGFFFFLSSLRDDIDGMVNAGLMIGTAIAVTMWLRNKAPRWAEDMVINMRHREENVNKDGGMPNHSTRAPLLVRAQTSEIAGNWWSDN